MLLFRLTNMDPLRPRYGYYESCIVVAENADEARAISYKKYSRLYGTRSWPKPDNPQDIAVERLMGVYSLNADESLDMGVILESYREG